MAELVIRKATGDDVSQIENLEKLCFAVPWSYESLKHDINENKLSMYIVAELVMSDIDQVPNNIIVGYIGIWNIVDEGHITNVAVSPKYRRQHIATIMIDTLIKSTEEAGIKRHSLEVRAGNTAAKNLYEGFGFVQAGLRKGYYEDNKEDAIIMWRG